MLLVFKCQLLNGTLTEEILIFNLLLGWVVALVRTQGLHGMNPLVLLLTRGLTSKVVNTIVLVEELHRRFVLLLLLDGLESLPVDAFVVGR